MGLDGKLGERRGETLVYRNRKIMPARGGAHLKQLVASSNQAQSGAAGAPGEGALAHGNRALKC
jgi:hypothetical protein